MPKPPPKPAEPSRTERLAAELRANLARRKQQVRSRRAGDADARDDGLAEGKRTSATDEGAD